MTVPEVLREAAHKIETIAYRDITQGERPRAWRHCHTTAETAAAMRDAVRGYAP